MFTNTKAHSQASSANPYEDKLVQPEQTQVLELSEQDLEQVSGGILPVLGAIGGAIGSGLAFEAGRRLYNPISQGVERLNNNSNIYRNIGL